MTNYPEVDPNEEYLSGGGTFDCGGDEDTLADELKESIAENNERLAAMELKTGKPKFVRVRGELRATYD